MLVAFMTALPVDDSVAHLYEVPGVVEPIRQITVQSTIDGRINAVDVEEGERIQQGQTMLRLDDSIARAELKLAQVAAGQTGKLTFAIAELERASQALARLEAVNDHHAIAARELEEARSNFRKAEGNVKVARDEIESLQMDLERSKLRLNEYSISAPFSGIVSKIRVSPGQVIQRQNVLMTLVDTTYLRTEVSVPIGRIRQLKVGEVYQLPVEAVAVDRVAATLIAIDPVLNAGTNTVRCVFEIDNRDSSLPAGFLAYPPKKLTDSLD